MSDLVQFRAIPTLDKQAVVFAGQQWRTRIAVADLPGFVRLYRGLRDRENGKFARFYVQPTEALEAVAKTLGIAVPDLRPKQMAVKK